MNRKSTTHEEKFVHVRDFHAIAKLVGATEYVPDTRYTGATVFARKTNTTGTWFATISLCSKSDQFNRRIGRQVARRRYFERPRKVFMLGDTADYNVLCGLALMAASAQ